MVTDADGERFLTNLHAGTMIGYKYFDLRATQTLEAEVRGKGTLVFGDAAAEVDSDVWTRVTFPVRDHGENAPVVFHVTAGNLEMRSFCLKECA